MDYKTLNLLYRFNKEFSHQRIRVKKISDTDCIMMTFVYDHPGCSQDDIVQTFRLDKTTVAKALSKLEERKLVTRLRGDVDRRKKALYLTDEGEQRIADLKNVHDDWIKDVFSVLSVKEQEQMDAIWAKLLKAAEDMLVKGNK